MRRTACSRKNGGFTLIEVLVTSLILSLVLGGAYTLFFSSQKIAGKATWLQYTVTNLRKTEMIITKAIKSTSYPTTLLPGSIFDAGGDRLDTPGPNSPTYYVHVSQGFGKRTASAIIGSNNGICMHMPRSLPEKRGFGGTEDRNGTIGWNVFRLEAAKDKSGLGTLIWEEREGSYQGTAPSYASTLTIDYTGLPLRRREVLLENVEWIEITADAPGHKPSKIVVTISAAFPKDRRTTRQGTSAAVPNVGVTDAP